MKNHSEKESTLLVTIGIPTYNGADGFLKDAINCALNQTYSNIEVIVSDNCSTDQTKKLVNSFSDKRIKYIRHSENIGLNKNFNFCLNSAKGKFFLLLCDDDLIDPDFIKVCLNAINYNTEIGSVFTGVRQIDESGNVEWEAPNNMSGTSASDFLFGWFDNKVALFLCSTLFNTEKLKKIGGFQTNAFSYQDVAAEVKLTAKYSRIDIYDVKASFRRRFGSNGSLLGIKQWCCDSLELLEIICENHPKQQRLLKQKGIIFLCRLIYNKVARIETIKKRFKAYLTVYYKFKFVSSPVKFIYKKDIRQIKIIRYLFSPFLMKRG